MRPAELVLIDDASTDDTLSILKLIKAEYGDWVNIISLEGNVGAASARNIGWNYASQPYIAFLDSDDSWHPQKVEIQYGYMNKNPSTALSGHLCSKAIEGESQNFNVEEIIPMKIVGWWELLLKNQFATPTIMVKKDIKMRFQKGKRYMEDHLLWLEIVSENLKAVKLNLDLASVHKPMYGFSGLSSNLLMMELEELKNYKYLHKKNKINLCQFIFLITLSLLKYIKRLIIVKIIRSAFNIFHR
jgi:glycosyltransferase involved in cell wall biosynthesis